MKKLVVRIFAFVTMFSLFFLVDTFSQKKMNIEKEKAAIKAAIQESSDAWNAKDFDRMSAVWVHDESIVRMGIGPGGTNLTKGW